MPHQYIGAFDASVGEQGVKLTGNLIRSSRLRSGIAPPHTGPVVGTHPGRLAKVTLNQVPVEGGAAQPGVKHHGRASRTLTLNMQPVTAYVDELAGRRV